MNLVNDLGIDLAKVFLVERKYEKRLDTARMREIIDEVRSVLIRSRGDEDRDAMTATAGSTSH